VLGFPRCSAASLGDLVVENSEKPGADLGPTLERGRGFEESEEGRLRHVLRLLGTEPGPSGDAVDLRKVGADDVLQRLRAGPERRKIGVFQDAGAPFHGPRLPEPIRHELQKSKSTIKQEEHPEAQACTLSLSGA
jgi:hypothetical protein